jgi:hypothetical protein
MTTALATALEEGFRERLGWVPHKAQRELLDSPARNRVFAGGRRVGKSQTGGHLLIPKAFSAFGERAMLEDKGMTRWYWIAGPEYSDSEKEFRVLYNGLKRLGVKFDHPGTYNNPHTGDMHISLWGGLFRVDALSAKYPDTLVGEGVSGVVLSEAAKLKPTVWPKYIRPTLADYHGWSYMGSTPEGKNWFYRRWQDGQNPLMRDWASWRVPSWENPHVYRDMRVFGDEAEAAIRAMQSVFRSRTIPERLPLTDPMGNVVRHFLGGDEAWEQIVDRAWADVGLRLGIDSEVMSMILDLSEELFNQEVAALFNEFVGRVFKEFDEEIHVGDFDYDPAWTTYACLDYGFTNPFVWLLVQVDPHRTNIRILDEYYESGRSTEEAGAEIKSRGLAPSSILRFFPDPAEPDRSVQLAGLLQIPSAGGTGGPLADRLEWIRRKLRPASAVAHLPRDHDEWVPQLQINRRCKDTIREFNAYRYPKSAEEAAESGKNIPEAPLKKDDHTPEALGRLMVGLFGSPWAIGESPARVSRARVGRTAARKVRGR